MKKKELLFVWALFASLWCGAQQPVEKYPLGAYEELTDTKPHDGEEVWNKMQAPVSLAWGSIDVRYPKLSIPLETKKGTTRMSAWKGERVHAQAVLWTRQALKNVQVKVGELKNGSSVIPASAVKTHFVRYVMTDELNKDGKGGCGHRPDKTQWDSSLVADVLDIAQELDVKERCSQPIWLTVWVPSDVKAGTYKSRLTVSAEGLEPLSLPFEVKVVNRTLPSPQDWKFDLDLWQNPYAVARYYQVPLWSKEHFDAMRPIMKMLANAGQKAITASIMHKPWNGQTEDHFDSMVTRIKKLDGSWEFGYAAFDKWVEFMTEDIGLKGLISCYTMIPWALNFDYYDEATNRVVFLETKPGDAAYAEYWGTFLKDFARHLREKGWFERTAISMDERPMEAMREAIKVVRAADPEFKITLAGNYHPEIEPDLYYYCIALGQKFPADVKKAREAKGQISTYYTCCAEAFPNTFTFSRPAEAVWTMVHAVAEGYDGYLRWSFNSWTADPLRDSRFRTWAAGDTYSVYPGPRSSIRFERMTEGVQVCEKIRILREEFTRKGDKGKLSRLNKMLTKFTLEALPDGRNHPEKDVNELHELLNRL